MNVILKLIIIICFILSVYTDSTNQEYSNTNNQSEKETDSTNQESGNKNNQSEKETDTTNQESGNKNNQEVTDTTNQESGNKNNQEVTDTTNQESGNKINQYRYYSAEDKLILFEYKYRKRSSSKILNYISMATFSMLTVNTIAVLCAEGIRDFWEMCLIAILFTACTVVSVKYYLNKKYDNKETFNALFKEIYEYDLDNFPSDQTMLDTDYYLGVAKQQTKCLKAVGEISKYA